jgi:hypothetical protein
MTDPGGTGTCAGAVLLIAPVLAGAGGDAVAGDVVELMKNKDTTIRNVLRILHLRPRRDGG